MRFMITAAPDPDAPKMPEAPFDEALFAAYMKFNEDLHKAGVLVVSEGLNPAGKRSRVGIKGGKRTVLDGPFAESKELVGGFYLIDVKSHDEAVQWALKVPVGMGFDAILTILPMTNASDIPSEILALMKKAAPAWSATFARD